MIETNKLRIGNIISGIYYDDDNEECFCNCTIVALDSTGSLMDYNIYVDGNSNSEMYHDFVPIPLTEEWLIKFGFKKIGNSNDWYISKFIIHKRKRGWVVNKRIQLVNYVHILQNIYFALKNKELKL